MKSVIALAGLLFLASFASAQAVEEFPEGCKLVRQASLPFQVVHGQMTVDVKVNGHPLHFIIDTGGVFSAISHDAVQATGLSEGVIPPNWTVKDVGGAQAHHFARIEDITFGTLKSKGLTLMVVNLPKGEDGIIAPDLLRNFDIDFDFANQMISLFKHHRCDDHVVYWTDDFVKIPMLVTDQGHMRIPVSINGAQFKATLDTGSSVTFIFQDAARSLFGPDAGAGATHHLRGGSGGTIAGAEVKPESFILGKFKWISPVVLASPDQSGLKGDGSQVLVGTDILHDLHIFADYKEGQLFVSKR